MGPAGRMAMSATTGSTTCLVPQTWRHAMGWYENRTEMARYIAELKQLLAGQPCPRMRESPCRAH